MVSTTTPMCGTRMPVVGYEGSLLPSVFGAPVAAAMSAAATSAGLSAAVLRARDAWTADHQLTNRGTDSTNGTKQIDPNAQGNRPRGPEPV